MSRLAGQVAVVTGASRGAGRGIAFVLGEEAATVYVTGRSVSGSAAGGRTETIDETAEGVGARGGVGIPVRCDHTADSEVEALIERVMREQGRLDILVCNAWGGYESGTYEKWNSPFWKEPLAVWDRMFTAGVRSHMVTARCAAPVMAERGGGLIVFTTVSFGGKYHGNLSYDVAKTAINRTAFCIAQDLREHGVAVIALAPGWMRTEKVLDHYKVGEENWQRIPALEKTESTQYVGRAIAALASDPDVMEKSGLLLEAADLAREYGFVDIDGRQVPPFRELFPELFEG